MSGPIISVRMPASLVDKLKILADRNHYLDLSEELRSILREKQQEYQDPYAKQLRHIKETVKQQQVPEKIAVLKKNLKILLEDLNEL